MLRLGWIWVLVSTYTLAQPPQVKEFNEIWEQIQHLKYHQPDSTKKLILNAIQKAEHQKQPLWKARFYIDLSKHYNEVNLLDSAVYFNDASAKINKQFKNEYDVVMNTLLTAEILSSKSDFVESIDYYLNVIEQTKKIDNQYAKLGAYLGLTNKYIIQRNKDLAYKYANEALNAAILYNHPLELAYCKMIMAEMYRVFGDFKKAEALFSEVFMYFSNNNNDLGKAKTLANWSIMYEDQLDKCLKMGFEAQEIFDKVAPTSGFSCSNLYNIGWGYYDLFNAYPNVPDDYKKYSKKQLLENAKSNFEKSLSITIKMKNKQWEMFNIGVLADVHYELKEFEKAYLMNNEYSKLKDSLFSQTNKNKIADLENRQKMLEKDQEIQLQELKIEQKEKEKWYFTGGLILLSIIGGMLWYQNQTRKRKNEALRKLNKELDEANKTKARFFSILNHDLRTPVSQLIQFIHLQQEAPELLNEATKLQMQEKTLKGAEHLLSTMEQLLLWSKSQMERFEPKFEKVPLASLFDEIEQTTQQHPEIRFEFELKSPEQIHTDPDYLKTILRNLNSNAIKALKNQKDPSILWKSMEDETGIYIFITDNGPGGDKDTFKALFDEQTAIGTKTGLGMHLIRDLTKAINGTLKLETESGKGTSIGIHFKA